MDASELGRTLVFNAKLNSVGTQDFAHHIPIPICASHPERYKSLAAQNMWECPI